MALLVVLVPAEGNYPPINAEAVEALARLGVTTVSLAQDEETIAVILEGWAFDPVAHGAALGALEALGVEGDGARTLQPVLHMAVSAAAKERGRL
jgi:hypothetical protein